MNKLYYRMQSENLIPKKIHYVWLGGKPKPKKVEKCIASWKKFMPDYEIKLWDESNVNLDEYKYLRTAYDCGKFGFTVDPLRLHILKAEGGIYLDSDVEAIRPLDEFLGNKAFVGLEAGGVANPGSILASTKDCKFLDELLDVYKNTTFNPDGKNEPSPIILSRYLKTLGLNNKDEKQTVGELTVYPTEYFCPFSPVSLKLKKTRNTVLIHHFAATWFGPREKFKKFIKRFCNFFTFGLAGVIFQKLKQKHQ